MKKITRRDFLKYLSLIGVGAFFPNSVRNMRLDDSHPNIIIILADAMSANNMSIYGYERETTPNITRFAERSIVYNNHYAGGNFTTPGTASMLSGMFQWKHRAFSHGGLVLENLESNNIFTLLGKEYFRLMFSQNPWPDRLVSQYYHDVDSFLPMTAFSFRGNNLIMDKVGDERYLASIAFDDFLLPTKSHVPGAALFGYINKSIAFREMVSHQKHPRYPTVVPEVEGIANYINEEIYQGVFNEILALDAMETPYFSYFHLFSPHSPYKPGKKYSKLYKNDGFAPIQKPVHPYAPGKTEEELHVKRLKYDRQVAHVDAEFGKLVDQLELNGVLDHSYIIFTSDHGEMFERGFEGHGEPLLYEAGIKIPQIIHVPGQTTRRDVFSPTSNIDLLPTLLSITGNVTPSALDGRVLPGLGGVEDSDRPLFSMYAVENSQFLPLTHAAISMHKEKYKLIAYLGYELLDGTYELYNLENDPEEMNDLAKNDSKIFSTLKDEFLDHLADANRPYEKA